MNAFLDACVRPRFVVLLALLFSFTLQADARLVEITVLHTTDLHGHVLPSYTYEGKEDVGGFLRCAAYIRSVYQEHPQAIYVDCGDLTQGGVESYLTNGGIMTRALESVGCDAWVIGNHEFDRGVDALARLQASTSLTKLGANITVRPGEEPALPTIEAFKLIDVEGVRVAIIGLTTPGIPYWSRPFLLKQVRVHSSVDTLQRVMPAVKAAQPDIIILAAHQGLKRQGDDFANELAAVARTFPEIDLILGGHSHRVIDLDYLHGIPYAQAGYHANWVGRVDLAFNTAEKKVVDITASVVEMGTTYAPDPELEKILKPELDAARTHSEKVVGSLSHALPGLSKVPGHSPQQQLISDAIREKSGCDFVIHGSFSEKIVPAGPVTQGLLWRMIPYENKIGVLQVTKDDLKTILEENAAKLKSFYLWETVDLNMIWFLATRWGSE